MMIDVKLKFGVEVAALLRKVPDEAPKLTCTKWNSKRYTAGNINTVHTHSRIYTLINVHAINAGIRIVVTHRP